MPWPAIISGVASLAGGLLGKSAQDDANRAQREIAGSNIQTQKEFAQHGIRWKVADAKKAGLHPLAALGAQTSSFSPVSVGTHAGNPLGNAISSMGQDISRAVTAAGTPAEKRLQKIKLAQEEARLQGFQLQNRALEKQLNEPTQGQSSIPTDNLGQPRTPLKPFTSTIEKVPLHQDGITVAPMPRYERTVIPGGSISERLKDPKGIDEAPIGFLKDIRDQVTRMSKEQAAYFFNLPKIRRQIAIRRPAAPPGKIFLYNPRTLDWNLHTRTQKNKNWIYSRETPGSVLKRLRKKTRPTYYNYFRKPI